MKVKRYTEAELPFAIAGLPSSLQAWGFDEALAAQRSQSMSDQHLRFLDRLLEVVDAGEAEQALRDEGAALAKAGFLRASQAHLHTSPNRFWSASKRGLRSGAKNWTTPSGAPT